jgi:alkylglycerol monooxygenase
MIVNFDWSFCVEVNLIVNVDWSFCVEVNLMWAGHQVHHSSDDYNLVTALRQSAIHRYVGWVRSSYRPSQLELPKHFIYIGKKGGY